MMSKIKLCNICISGLNRQQVIRNHPSALQIYQKKLLELGQVTQEEIDKINEKVNSILNEEFVNSKDYVPQRRDWLSAYWSGFKSPEQVSRIRNTGYLEYTPHFLLERLLYLFDFLMSKIPSGFVCPLHVQSSLYSAF